MTESQPKSKPVDNSEKKRKGWWRLPLAGLVGATGAAVAADQLTEGEVSQAALAYMQTRAAQVQELLPDSQNPESGDWSPINEDGLRELDGGTFYQLQQGIEQETARRETNQELGTWLLEPSTIQKIASLEGANPIQFPHSDQSGWSYRQTRQNVETNLHVIVTTETSQGVVPQYDNTFQFTLTGEVKRAPFGTLAKDLVDSDGYFRFLDKATINLYDLKKAFLFNAFGIIQRNDQYQLVISRSDTLSPGYGYYVIPLNLDHFDQTSYNNYVDFSEIQRMPNSDLKIVIRYSSLDGYQNFTETIIVPLKNKRFEEFGMKKPGDSRPPQAIARANERQFRNTAMTSGRATANGRT